MEMYKTIQARENTMKSMMDRTSRTHPGPTITMATTMTSAAQFPSILRKDRTQKRKHPNTKL